MVFRAIVVPKECPLFLTSVSPCRMRIGNIVIANYKNLLQQWSTSIVAKKYVETIKNLWPRILIVAVGAQTIVLDEIFN